MKKSFILILALLAGAFLRFGETQAVAAGTSPYGSFHTSEYLEAYAPVLDSYRAYLNGQEPGDYVETGDGGYYLELGKTGISELCLDGGDICYELRDLNGDDVPELIISSTTQTQCSITVNEMAESERMMKALIPSVKDEFIKTCLDPQFEIKQDPETNEWIYDSPKLTYRIKTIPEQYEGQAKAYADFANRYALLNVILSPQNMPPLARMEVNNDLAKKRLLPEEIFITLQPKYKPLTISKGKETIRTTHTIIKGLGNADMNQIRQAGERYGRYKQVSFEQYQKKLRETLEKK